MISLGLASSITVLLSAVVGVLMAILANIFVTGSKSIASFWGGGLNGLNISPEFDFTLFGLALAALIIFMLRLWFKFDRVHGPADSIYAAHLTNSKIDLRRGLQSSLIAFVSISGGAPVGQYGPLVHLGGVVGSIFNRWLALTKASPDVWIGCGVAAAIAAGFQAPIAGVVFAHEAVLRHLSFRAITPICVASITSYALTKNWFNLDPIFYMEFPSVELLWSIPILIVSGSIFGLVAVMFMKSLFWFGALGKKIEHNLFISLFIGFAACAVIGTVSPEVLGLGSETINAIFIGSLTLGSLLLILLLKIIASSVSIGFGMYGGVFSPALFLGASTGGCLTKLFSLLGVFLPSHLLPVAGMASVAACVVGAPLSMVIIVLELTLSYELAVIAMVSTAVSIQVASLWLGHSFFDEQLMKRGVNLSDGRTNLQLSQMSVEEISTQDYVCFSPSDNVGYGIRELKNNLKSEGYCIDKGSNFIGKFRVIDLIDADKEMRLVDFCLSAPIVLSADESVFDAVNIAKNFVGDSMPVLCREKKQLIGVVSEADIFTAYIEVQNQASKVEHV
jgi:CIC family chloride channel protein